MVGGFPADACKQGGITIHTFTSRHKRQCILLNAPSWVQLGRLINTVAAFGAWLSFLLATPLALAVSSIDADGTIEHGISLRQQGSLLQSIALLGHAREDATDPKTRARAAGELGIALLQAHRHDAADVELRHAYDFFKGAERAHYAIYLGNQSVSLKKPEEARTFYREAQQLAPDDIDIQLSAGLNLARVSSDQEKPGLLAALSRQLAKQTNRQTLIRHHLNLGRQAEQLGGEVVPLAFHHLDIARSEASIAGDQRLLAQALDALAQLYEKQGRKPDALQLTRQALDALQTLSAGLKSDILINLEWRQARLFKEQGRPSLAMAAYRRAVDQIELVRQDIPVEYENGLSSFHETLEPIYMGYADLMLQQLDTQSAQNQTDSLRQVINTLEMIRQAELQDFLGDRCAVEAVQGGSARHIPDRTAVLYPLILPDRIELLLVTSNDIVRRTTQVKNSTLRQTATAFSASLRHGEEEYIGASKKLYDWLLRPFDEALKDHHVHTLVVVPDGVLRLVPMSSLHDGQQYAIEKYAISMVTGLTMTNSAMPAKRSMVALVAGLSEPGSVVDKLGPLLASKILQPGGPESSTRGLAKTKELRAIRSAQVQAAGSYATDDKKRQIDRLRAQLALPGVKAEVNGLASILKGANMLNDTFTVNRFRSAAETGDYRIVHIASHGIFGGNAENSFIMAYDDVLNMNALQALLKAEKFQRNPIELLSLSACQTAEGNDRAPLGISGAAIKARAKSVLGTLWPVEDDAAKTLMEALYSGLSNDALSKTEALRLAQIKLIRNPESNHPFFWAPFVLIGNWL